MNTIDNIQLNEGQKNYHYWKKTLEVKQPATNDLELLGVSFDAFQHIYLLCGSSNKNKLYLARYNILENKLSKFKFIGELPEKIYQANIYEENFNYQKWYLLGNKNIWDIKIYKNSSSSNEITSFAENLYPIDYHNNYRNHEGGTQIIFDKIPWIIGGKLIKNAGIDTRSRVLVAARWGAWLNGRKGAYWRGLNKIHFLTQKRVNPIVHMTNDKLICIGGVEDDSQENVIEFIPIRPFYIYHSHGSAREDEFTKIFNTERSLQLYDGLNYNIKTNFPKPASCVFNNSIFIFSNTLFDSSKPIYCKYNFANKEFGGWEFLQPENYKSKEFIFSSAKVVPIGNTMYLILFNSNNELDWEYLDDEPSNNGTQIKIFKITE